MAAAVQRAVKMGVAISGQNERQTQRVGGVLKYGSEKMIEVVIHTHTQCVRVPRGTGNAKERFESKKYRPCSAAQSKAYKNGRRQIQTKYRC